MKRPAQVTVAVLAMLLTLALGATSASADAPPTVTIDPASEVGVTGAKLEGTVDPEGGPSATVWRFEVAPTSDPEAWNYVGGGTISSEEPEGGGPIPSHGTDPIAVEADATSLQPETAYRVRIVAENEQNPETGEFANRVEAIEPSTFTTGAATDPTLSLEPASPSYLSAHLEATIDPEGGNFNPATGPVPLYWSLQISRDIANEGWITYAEGEIAGAEAEGSAPVLVQTDISELQHDTDYQYRVLVYYLGFSREAEESGSFQTLEVTKPTVSIEPASGVTFEQAHLSGNVDPGGADEAFKASCRFEYLTDAQYAPGNEVQKMTIYAIEGEYTLTFEGEETAPIAFNASPAMVQGALEALPNIAPGEVAVSGAGIGLYRIAFSGSLGGRNITDFQIDPGTLTRGPGASPTATLAAITEGKVEGFVGASSQALCVPDPVQGAAEDVVADLTEIEPNTTYHFRLRAENLGGVSFSGEQTFKTLTSGPTVIAGTVGALTSTSARLTAYVDANNTPTTATFEYDTDPGFGSPATAPGGLGATVSGNGSQVAYVDVSGLTPEATYHWRVSVESSEGADADTAPRGFKPWPTPPAKGDGVGAFGDRVIERVSPNDEMVTWGGGQLSEDGQRMLFSAMPGSDAAEYGGADGSQLLAIRGEYGWESIRTLPSRAAIGASTVRPLAASPDLTRFISLAFPEGLGGNVAAPPFHHALGSDQLQWGPTHLGAGASATYLISRDLSTIATSFTEPQVPEDPAPSGGLYDLSGPELELIGFLPNGEAPACGVDLRAFELLNNTTSLYSQNWISHNGEQILFHTRGNDCSAPEQLYMREGGAEGTTTWISGPAISGPETEGRFLQATSDGSQVFFTSSSVLDPADTNESLDVYRYVIGAGRTCITCVVSDPHLNASPELKGSSAVLAAEDGARVYFTSNSRLVPGAAKGVSNMYVWRASEPGEIGYVGPFDRFASTAAANIMATKDGSVLIVGSTRAELDALTAGYNGGKSEYYRYDDRDGTLSCVSCPPEGVEPVGTLAFANDGSTGFVYNAPSGLGMSGLMYAFYTAEALVPADVNQTTDVYEWREGVIGLITDGHEAGEVDARDASEDGRSVVFNAARKLTADSPDDRKAVYVARIGGGFPQVPPPTPCTGEGCQGAPAAPPVGVSPTSNQFSGPGNRVEKPPKRCAKNKAKRKGRCVKRKPSKQRQRNRKGNSKKRASAKQGGSK